MLRRASLPLALCLALPVSLLASTAQAAPPVEGAEGKKLRMHFDTEFFSFTHFNPSEPDGSTMDVPNTNGVGFGIGSPIILDRGPFGEHLTRTPTFGFGFGAVVLDSRAIVGGEATFVINQAKTNDDDTDSSFQTVAVGGYLVPYFRWMFMKGSWVRPYVEGRFGFGGGVTSNTTDVMGTSATERDHTIFPTAGAGGGAMFFFSDFFSLDAGLNLDYAAPHSRETFDPEPDPPPESDDWDKVGDVLNVSVSLGVSIWFDLAGGGSASAGATARR